MSQEKRLLDVNGPGSNGLRGGIKTYSAKTVTGAWLEEYGGPGGYKRGFHHEDFETEAQHAQSGALGKNTGRFGAAISEPKEMDLPVNALIGTENVEWVTNTQAIHRNLSQEAKTTEDFELLQPTHPREQIEEYRETWTVDKESNRKVRYVTESRLAANQAAGKFFQISSVRFLPGTPKSMEDYRSRLIQRYGIFGIGQLKLLLGNTGTSCAAFKANIRKLGVDIKPYEVSQILAYITPSQTDLSAADVQKFVTLTRGTLEGFDSSTAREAFRNIAANCGTRPAEGLVLADVQAAINSDAHPEILEGISIVFPAYADALAEERISEDSFVELLHDMFVSVPTEFDTFLRSVWRAT